MTVLITGAAGFIGSHAAVRLLERGDTVVGLDNLNDYYSPVRKRHNLGEVAGSARDASKFVFVEGDIRDRALLGQLFVQHDFTAVVHLAAVPGVRSSVDDPWQYLDVNLTGTLNLLEAARAQAAPANFVLASTSSVYGRTETLPFVETDVAGTPLAPYPASKRAAEMLGFTYHHLYGLDFTALRFFTVYGPRNRPDMMAYKVLASAFGGDEVPYFNAGQMHRDWTFVGDIVSAIVAAADRRLGYQIVNVGRGEPVLVADFVDSLTRLAGKAPRLKVMAMPEADVNYTYADISKARELLDYQPQVSVAEGARQLFDWYVREVRH
jgi:UDP-glucuronate 4-epimerase